MSNLITYKAHNEAFAVNNSWTPVFYATLLISGSVLAQNQWEKQFMIWLAEHDPEYFGMGFVGMDFNDIPWTTSDFEHQQTFVAELARKAIREKSWKKLDCKHNESILIHLLNQWIHLFQQATIDDFHRLRKDFPWRCKPMPNSLDQKCSKHHIFLNRLGQTESECCYICHALIFDD